MLETAWLLIWALLWAVYFALDGFDLGAGALMPFLARSERDRIVTYNAVGPFWDGNEVWLVTAGAVTFAAFPAAYATLFSALYSPLMIILFALIIRGAAVGLRGELPAGRGACDAAFAAGSAVPALLFGVAFANIFKGLPIDAAGEYHGSLAGLLNVYGLAGGAAFLCFFLLSGCIWMAMKSEGPLHARAARLAPKLAAALAVLAVVFLVATGFHTGIWAKYAGAPALAAIPAAAVVALVATVILVFRGAWGAAWGASSSFIAAVVFFGVVGTHPDIIPSSLDPAHSVTVSGAASSPLTLKIMLGVVAVFIPFVVFYQALAYRLFRGKASGEGYGH